jgi:hypothetical protein
MSRILLFTIAVTALIACNNKVKSENSDATTSTTSSDGKDVNMPSGNLSKSNSAASISYTIQDTARNGTASVLVTRDEDKLSPGNDLFAMITANLPGDESLVVNFLFTTKPGTYPVVGLSFSRTNQVFGGLLGGKKKITPYKVNLTEVKDLGSNNAGGHRWMISGNIESDVVIDAMGVMKFDKTHPDNITVSKISFNNLSFDDNWEELVEKALGK